MGYRWVSWYWTKEMGAFELHAPWWISGYRMADEAATVCAAFPAEISESEAEIFVAASYDNKPESIEWRFNNLKEGEPFCERFPKADWMTWPMPVTRFECRPKEHP
jgi:hypothetical protein